MKSLDYNEDRFSYLRGFANLIGVFLVVWLLWYVLMNQYGIFKLFRMPNHGLSLITVFFSSIVMMIYVIEYYPFKIEKMNTFNRGVFLLIICVILAILIYYLIFRNFIGRFGVAYFSPASIMASGGVGAKSLNTDFMALDRSSKAIYYFHFAFLWIVFFWNLGFNRWPWNDCSRSVSSWSKLITIILLTIITYSILFHPYVCYLFNPVQSKAGVAPWWTNIAGTGSAYFNLGLLFCTLTWIIISTFLWEGYPWKMITRDRKGSIAKGVVVFFGTLALGIITMIILMKVMNIFWGEAFPGGGKTDGIDFRYIRSGEICSLFILVTYILKYYFNNFPNTLNIWSRAVLRSVITISGGLIIYFVYYSKAGTVFLGFETGLGFPFDTPTAFVMFFLIIIFIQNEFFQGWPLRKDKRNDLGSTK